MSAAPPLEALEPLWELMPVDPRALEQRLEDLPDCPEKLVMQGQLYYRSGEIARALEVLQAALAALPGRTLWRSRALAIMATVMEALMRHDEVLPLYEEWVELAREIGDQRGEVAAIHDLGESLRQGNPAFAAQCYEQARALAHRYRLPSLEAIANLNLAQVGVQLGHSPAQRTRFLKAAERLAQESWPEIASYARVELIADLLDQGDLSEASVLIAQLPLPTDFFDTEIGGQVGLIRARYLAASGQMEQAIETLEAALEVSHVNDQVRICSVLSGLYEQIGRLPDALRLARREIELQGAQLRLNREQSLAALEVWYKTAWLRETAEGERERADGLAANLKSLQEAHERIRELSIRDTLTGLHNRQYLIEAGTLAVKGSSEATPSEVALLDIDRFKAINDIHGHQAGDQVLRFVGSLLSSHLPASDLVARYGGEEFVVIRPPRDQRTSDPSLAQDLEEFRRLLLRTPCEFSAVYQMEGSQTGPLPSEAHPTGQLFVHMSIGVKTITGTDLQSALHDADLLMYEAKRSGGNRVRVPV